VRVKLTPCFISLIPEKEPTGYRVSIQLRNLEMFTAEEVIQEWSLSTASGDVEGQSSRGQGVLSIVGEVLQVYLLKGYLESMRNPKALVDQFVDFCSNSKEYGRLLQTVMTESDHTIIESDFQADGIPALSPDDPFADHDQLCISSIQSQHWWGANTGCQAHTADIHKCAATGGGRPGSLYGRAFGKPS
jgi:hypothetical protein